MANDKITTIKVKQKDKDSMKNLSCANFGMTYDRVFEIMLSFCLKESERLKKWNIKLEEKK